MTRLTRNQRDYLAMQTKSDEELRQIIERERRLGGVWLLVAGLCFAIGILAAIRLGTT